MTADPSLSIIIANYNYAAYVGHAIESALAVRCGRREVIVVDDGSTDNSLAVIGKFEGKIKIIAQPNLGQTQSYRRGFDVSSGDVIIFLDADDILHPDLMTEIVKVWHDGISKIQVQVATINSEGKAFGGLHPQFHEIPSPQQIRKWALETGAYPTPAGSGNAYARWFVSRVFQLPTSFVDRANDSYMLAAAPFLGDVVTIAKPLASYRIHGLNQGAQAKLDDARFANEIERTRRRFAFSMEVAAVSNLRGDDGALDRNLRFLSLRMTSLCLRPDLHPIANDARISVLTKMVGALAYPQGFSRLEGVFLVLWAGIVSVAPSASARKLISWRYVPQSRPKGFFSVLSKFGVLRARNSA